jgi:alkaline phosphatase
MKAGVVSTAQITHATPAATYAHINQRNNENDIALQALPTDATYNERLGTGIDVLMGGGRRFFVPSAVIDEEGGAGGRADGRDLRAEYQAAGYNYVWNTAGFKEKRAAKSREDRKPGIRAVSDPGWRGRPRSAGLVRG